MSRFARRLQTVKFSTANQAPSAPSGLSITPSQTSLALSWTAASDPDGTVASYEIRVNGTLNGTSTSLSYNVTGLTASTTYTIAVRAVDNLGLSGSDVTGSGTTSASGGAVLAGWYRTTSNTGLAGVGTTSGMLTNYTGPTTLTAGTHLYRQNINLGGNTLLIQANNVILEECSITGSAWMMIAIGRNMANGAGISLDNVQLLNCDFIGTGGASSEQYLVANRGAGNYVMQGCLGRGGTIFAMSDNDVNSNPQLIDQCYFYGGQNGGSAHHDGITRRAGQAQLTITNTRVTMDQGSTTGALFLQPTYGSVGNVTMNRCYLEGNGNNCTLEVSNDIIIDDNRFRPTEYSYLTTYNGPVTRLTWTNNYIYSAAGTDGKGAPAT